MHIKNIVLPLIFSVILLTSCNSGIFVDEPLPDEGLSATVQGDGGVATFTIPVKDLNYISLDVFSENIYNVEVYNNEGEVIDRNSPASEVSKIVYTTNLIKIEIHKNGGTLSFVSICNAWDTNCDWNIRLEYSYGARFIHVTALPGKALEIQDVYYSDDLLVWNDKTVTDKFKFINDGPLPQRYEVRPYLNQFGSIDLEMPNDIWANGMPLTMPVPMYVDGKWELVKKSGIKPGRDYTFEGPDRFTKVDVEIPANSSVTIYTYILRSSAEGRGVVTFYNEILDIIIPVMFKIRTTTPTGHEIRVEIDNAK